MTSFAAEQRVYSLHVLALFRPGAIGPIHAADPNVPGELRNWKSDDYELLIAEGRRQVDRQVADLERVRGRSQYLMTLALALVGTTGALLGGVNRVGHPVLWVIWIAAVVVGGWAALGAAATSVVAAEPEIVHASALSRYTPPVRPLVAADYAAIVVTGENHVAVRLTNLRWAVTYVLVGATLTLISWSWIALDRTSSSGARNSSRSAKTSVKRGHTSATPQTPVPTQARPTAGRPSTSTAGGQ